MPLRTWGVTAACIAAMLAVVHVGTGEAGAVALLAAPGVVLLSLPLVYSLRPPIAGGTVPVRTAVIGSVDAMEALAEELTDRRASRYVLVGRITRDGEAPCPRTLGPVSSLCDLVERHEIDLVLVGRDAPRMAALEALGSQIECVSVRLMDVSDFYERVFGYVPIGDASAAWLSYLLHPRYRRGSSRAQRLFDIVAAASISLVFLPVVIIAAVLIKLDGGPVFFGQVRIGERGRPITIFKLRTMRVSLNADTRWCQVDDPRITRVGRWLRRLHLDELPQLYNVLRGDMRIVGPRPEQPHYVERLEAALPFYARRHMVKPGLTGWAQVRCGYAGSDIGSAWKLCHDLYYLKHQSLRLDVSILFATAVVLLMRHDVLNAPGAALAKVAARFPATELAGSGSPTTPAAEQLSV